MAPNAVSIVTTTWNEKENIEKLFPAIRRALQLIPHETIIVDDSPDGTSLAAKPFADLSVTKARERQTKGLLHACKKAK